MRTTAREVPRAAAWLAGASAALAACCLAAVAGESHPLDVGPAARRPAPALPLTEDATKLAPIDRLPRHWSSWPVVVQGSVRPHDVIRVALPPEMFVPGTDGPENMRPVVAGQKVIPFALDTDPAPVVLGPDLDFKPVRRPPHDAACECALPAPVRAATQLELFRPAGAAPFAGTISVSFRAVTRPGVPPAIVAGPSAPWTCDGGEEPACHLFLRIAPPDGATALEITVDHARGTPPGASPWAAGQAGAVPLPRAGRLWARRHALVFAWPEAGGEVRVISGFDPVRTDAPQVIAVRQDLLGREQLVATLDLARTAEETERLARTSNRALLASLVIVAVVLFGVLARAMRRT